MRRIRRLAPPLFAAVVGVTALVGLGAAAQPPATAPAEPAAEATDWTERLFWNARERTAASRQAFEGGDPQAAVEPARAARRLAPEDPVTGLNLGSALLGADQAQEALPHLEQAAEALEGRYAERPSDAHRRLAATAHYNRGNARRAAGDLEGAIRAYEQALRRSPTHQDAKFNLELALREQERRQQEQGEDGQQEDGSEDPETRDESQGGEDRQPDAGEEPESGEGSGQEEQEQPQQPEPQEAPQQPAEPEPQGQGDDEPEPSRLPQFEDQPDMTADEAAAILENVENLERERRREEAERRARQRPAKEKDW